MLKTDAVGVVGTDGGPTVTQKLKAIIWDMDKERGKMFLGGKTAHLVYSLAKEVLNLEQRISILERQTRENDEK